MGWLVALVGILLVVVNPLLGIGLFVVGVLIVLGGSNSGSASAEATALSAVVGLLIGCIVLLIGLSAIVGVFGAFF